MKHEILVIEDDKPLRWLLERILKGKFNVTITKDSLSAMAWLSGGNLPSLILCDFDLPGINGLSLLRSLSSSGAFSEIPVVIFSANTSEELVESCLSAGASACIHKPFDPLKLIDVIDGALAENKSLV